MYHPLPFHNEDPLLYIFTLIVNNKHFRGISGNSYAKDC